MLDHILFPLSITLWIAAISSILVLCSGVIIDYLFAKLDFRGKELAELFVSLPIFLSPTVIGYLLVVLVGKNGFLGQLIFKVLGRSELETALSITFPLAKRGIKGGLFLFLCRMDIGNLQAGK
jgi:molybdate transport system permease protein